jgi:hypothetical protein
LPGLKKQLKGRQFSSYTEVNAAAETNFWIFFFSWLQKLEQRAEKFIELCGEYVE